MLLNCHINNPIDVSGTIHLGHHRKQGIHNLILADIGFDLCLLKADGKELSILFLQKAILYQYWAYV